MIITVYKVPKLCFYSAILEPDHFVVGCLSFLLFLERNTLTVGAVKSSDVRAVDETIARVAVAIKSADVRAATEAAAVRDAAEIIAQVAADEPVDDENSDKLPPVPLPSMFVRGD